MKFTSSQVILLLAFNFITPIFAGLTKSFIGDVAKDAGKSAVTQMANTAANNVATGLVHDNSQQPPSKREVEERDVWGLQAREVEEREVEERSVDLEERDIEHKGKGKGSSAVNHESQDEDDDQQTNDNTWGKRDVKEKFAARTVQWTA